VDADFYGIASGKLRRYLSRENLADAFRVLAGIWQAWRLLGRLRPDVVFSKGGFVSFPVVLAAWLRRVPVVAHESDLTPGLANRLALPFVRTLCVTFAETRARGSAVAWWSPARRCDRRCCRATAPWPGLLGAAPERPVLLVAGGSLGAEASTGPWTRPWTALLDLRGGARARAGQRRRGRRPATTRSSTWAMTGAICWPPPMWWCPGRAPTPSTSCWPSASPTC
jgi:hypothetical protein